MRVAITGGIGSGKSYVCGRLAARGIEVYDCDAAAKRLLRHDVELRRLLVGLVGPEVYAGDVLQKAVLAQYLLASEEHKQAVNDVVHPAVARDFLASGYEWLESAILFDSGFDRRIPFDVVVCVVAPLEVRLARVMHRDGIAREAAMAWISRQMAQQDVVRRSDFVITNDGEEDIDKQITELIKHINNK